MQRKLIWFVYILFGSWLCLFHVILTYSQGRWTRGKYAVIQHQQQRYKWWLFSMVVRRFTGQRPGGTRRSSRCWYRQNATSKPKTRWHILVEYIYIYLYRSHIAIKANQITARTFPTRSSVNYFSIFHRPRSRVFHVRVEIRINLTENASKRGSPPKRHIDSIQTQHNAIKFCLLCFKFGMRPLHMAARYGHRDAVKMLINAGASVSAVNKVRAHNY